jgi:BirA family biotin operon repressor/biotin-[acetyl-CoA-carboxylase] ligase
MTKLNIRNPFNAPVYHEETVTSTMDVSRALASGGEPHGTVIAADFQGAGRGRVRDRTWNMEEKSGLPFTLLLRYPRIEDIPSALTLRIGLAVSLAIEDFAPSLKGSVMVKWPNDIFIGSKKTAGILCEADGGNIHAGIGINFAQKEFPAHLREKAASIAIAAKTDFAPQDRFILLEKILIRLFAELETANVAKDGGTKVGGAKVGGAKDWKPRLEQRLYKNGEPVIFIEGAAGSGREVRGRLAGIGEGGELLIVPEGETQARAFVTGELVFS